MLVANYPNASHASPSFLMKGLGQVRKTVFREEEFCDKAFAEPGTSPSARPWV
jgi:hypothetical protein